MSALCPLPSSLPERLGARVQRDALAPFPFPRLRAAPWDLNRSPYDFPQLSEFGWARKERLHPGEELGEQPGVGAPAPTPEREPSPAQQQRARSLRAAINCPDYTTLVLHLDVSAHTTLEWRSVVSGALPAPCRIEQITFIPRASASNNQQFARVLLVDEGLEGTSTTVNGEDLIDARRFTDSINPNELGAQGFELVTVGAGMNAMPTVLNVGRAIDEPGKRIQFSVFNATIGQVDTDLQLYVTLLQCPPGPAIAPRSASARQVSARPRPAPRPAPPPPPAAPAPRGHTSSGAYPIAGSAPGVVPVITRWALPSQPGRTFATLPEANVAYQAEMVGALPRNEQFAAAQQARIAASQLLYGAGAIRSPTEFILGGPGATTGVARTRFGAGRLEPTITFGTSRETGVVPVALR